MATLSSDTSRAQTRKTLWYISSYRLCTSFRMPVSLVLILIYAQATTASSIPSNLGEWLHGQPVPLRSFNFPSDIKCYGLPYGGIGLLSHVLTYYTFFMLLAGKPPLIPIPGRKLTHRHFNFVLGIVGGAGSITVAALNMGACRRRWQLVCIAFWQLSMSFTLCSISIHQTMLLFWHRNDPEPILWWSSPGQYGSTAILWIICYLLGTVVGMAGLLSLVAHTFENEVKIRSITLGFAIGAFCILGFWFIDILYRKMNDLPFTCFLVVFLFGFLSVFYCDWILAAFAGNWSGIPNGDLRILYWIYFVANRLPTFLM